MGAGDVYNVELIRRIERFGRAAPEDTHAQSATTTRGRKSHGAGAVPARQDASGAGRCGRDRCLQETPARELWLMGCASHSGAIVIMVCAHRINPYLAHVSLR